MGFFSPPRRTAVSEPDPSFVWSTVPAELQPGAPGLVLPPDSAPIAVEPGALLTAPQIGADAGEPPVKLFAQEPRPAVDPIFGTPIEELQPWIAPPPEETPTEDAGPRVDVEVLGSGYQVNGTLTTGKFERLSDWLNMQQGWCNIQDGTLFRPGHEDAAANRPRTGQWVRLDHIVLVAERQTEKRDRPNGPYVRKQRRRVTMVTQDYMLRGHIHLVESGSMQQFLESPDPHFIPMTDVLVRWLVDEAVVSHYPFALVNRDQLISVSEEVERDEAIAQAAHAGQAGQGAQPSRGGKKDRKAGEDDPKGDPLLRSA